MPAPAPKKVEPITGLGYDPNFGGLDLSGCPSVQPLPKDEDASFVDENFGGLVSESRTRLRDVLPKMVEQAGSDPEIARLLKEAGIENPNAPSIVHVCDEPFKVFFDQNTWRSTGTLAGIKYNVTAEDREGLLGKLTQLARRVEAERIHELTESERLQVVRLAQSGDVRGAIALHLRLSIGEERANQYENPNEMMGDRALAGAFDEAAALTWFAARPQVQDSAEFQEFLERYRGGRPLTHDLLDGAHARFQEDQYKRTPLLPPKKEATPTEIRQSLEDADDETIRRTYWSTATAIARAAR